MKRIRSQQTMNKPILLNEEGGETEEEAFILEVVASL